MQSRIALSAVSSSSETFGLNAANRQRSNELTNSSLVYTERRIGPSQLPYGTPDFSGKVDETPPFTSTALPSTPNLHLRRLSRVSCRTVSNAALRSRSTKRVSFCASKAKVNRNTVELPLRNCFDLFHIHPCFIRTTVGIGRN